MGVIHLRRSARDLRSSSGASFQQQMVGRLPRVRLRPPGRWSPACRWVCRGSAVGDQQALRQPGFPHLGPGPRVSLSRES